ncbi:hypothetical protein [Rhizobium laguerreae]|uniref:hypothetical protein n=1 Tax=Rhizobium laguerreae TaxID=1076926 RepID=UPI001C8FE39B|nr:hypothetical protein [Rhizobium laguerreae]MBY3315080.1 hypothetical protein [Rhizobium laguerreae]
MGITLFCMDVNDNYRSGTMIWWRACPSLSSIIISSAICAIMAYIANQWPGLWWLGNFLPGDQMSSELKRSPAKRRVKRVTAVGTYQSSVMTAVLDDLRLSVKV